MNVKKYFVAAFAALLTCAAQADEGMWLLQLLKEQNSIELMKKQGLKLEADDLYNPNGVSLKDAVGIFGGGCTGEIISPEGLILTNHHCGYGAIQQHSSVEHDYLTDGFWAMSRAEELPTPGLKFRFVHRIVDVTDLVDQKVKAGEVDEYTAMTSPFLRKVAQDELAKSDLAGKPGIVAQALPFYAGNKTYLIYYKVYSDVRMVAAPPSSVGKFGGETDNWMWPRHTGDFSIFRIYADKNGEPAEYSADNVPLKTPKFLPISIKGLNEGDYAMIMGFPGSTERYLTQSEVRQMMTAQNQAMIDMRTIYLDVLKKRMHDDHIRIQYASKYAGSSNYWKNSIGMNKAIIDNDVLGTKAEQEKQFAQFAKGKPEYEGLVEKIDAIVEKATPVMRRYMYLSEALRTIEFGCPPAIMDKIKEALETKNDSLLAVCKEQLQKVYDSHLIGANTFHPAVDHEVANAMIPALAHAVGRENIPELDQIITERYKGVAGDFIEDMYNNSILSCQENLDRFWKKPTVKAIEKDPATLFSRAKLALLQRAAKELAAATEGLDLLHKAYIRGLNEMKLPTPSYPDANFTIRLTYGNVKAYDPKDGVHYKYYTTTDGILEKEDPKNPEFVVPAKLKELIQKKDFGRYAMADGTMPVCFLTTNDITGGNSGSPVIDGEGNLIGCAFDGNWESLSGDINFDDNLQRCIALDIRYMLFILEKLGGCKHLIDEMTIIE